jgi:hypothetical protein
MALTPLSKQISGDLIRQANTTAVSWSTQTIISYLISAGCMRKWRKSRAKVDEIRDRTSYPYVPSTMHGRYFHYTKGVHVAVQQGLRCVH